MTDVQTYHKIRQAEVEDTAELLEMIKELAEFEKMSNDVTATEELLRITLFGMHSPAEVQVAYDDNGLLGYALYYRTFSTFLGLPGIYLEDLYVREAARGRGIGQALLSKLAQRTLEIGGGRLEWSVLDWNQSAMNFYEKMGARRADGWTTNRLTGEELENLASNSSF